MKLFSVPTCPYCKKRVNIIRTWTLKRQGEYRCPRCSGISNIYLSPLVHVFAVLAIFAGGAIYFFHKFILDDVELTTLLQVFIPFAIFFLISLFMVYLEKPVIKTSPKKSNKRSRPAAVPRGAGQNAPVNSSAFYGDADEYLPHEGYKTGRIGPVPQQNAAADKIDSTTVMPNINISAQARPAAPARVTAKQPAQRRSASTAPAAGTSSQPVRPARSRTAPSAPAAANTAPAPQKPTAESTVEKPKLIEIDLLSPADKGATTETRAERASSKIEDYTDISSNTSYAGKDISSSSDSAAADDGDFFTKYNDPAYIEKRLKEINREQ